MRLHHDVDRADDGDDGEDEEENDVHSASPRDDESGHQQIQERDWKQDFPRKAHQLVITKSRESAADPNEDEEKQADFSRKPEQRDERLLEQRQQKKNGQRQEYRAEHRERE